MGFERPDDFEGLGEDVDVAITAANKYIVGTGADTVKVITLAMSALGCTVYVGR